MKVNGKETKNYVDYTLESIAKEEGIKNAYCATANGRLRELTYVLNSKNIDKMDLVFLDLTSSFTHSMYQSTLRYILTYAIYRIDPKLSLKLSYSISRSILGVIENAELDNALFSRIIEEVKLIIKENYPIRRVKISKEEAVAIYEKQGFQSKLEVLGYRPENTVNLYECNGFYNYMYNYMLPSTGYITEYNIFQYSPGFLIQYPRAEEGGKIPKFEDAPVFSKALKESSKWGRITKGNTIPKMNEYAKGDLVGDFVNLCETKHNDNLCHLGDTIYAQKEDIRLICIAGPSSSGKTTFCNRLRIELMSKGLNPMMISIDDYYMPKDQAPKDKDGNPDLEHIEALDIAQFNADMSNLIKGATVTLPKFDFKLGYRVPGKTVKISEDTPILIEGIHALNDRLTDLIPRHQKYKIYIAPQTSLHIDNHSPISITDLRLIRRSVRDQQFRGTSAIDTISMWNSVRAGEFKWIYPYQEQADYVFNTELTYELNVLKKHAIKSLLQVRDDSPYFITANRLVKFLKYFVDIKDDLVPANSLLREFIGGSNYQH